MKSKRYYNFYISCFLCTHMIYLSAVSKKGKRECKQLKFTQKMVYRFFCPVYTWMSYTFLKQMTSNLMPCLRWYRSSQYTRLYLWLEEPVAYVQLCLLLEIFPMGLAKLPLPTDSISHSLETMFYWYNLPGDFLYNFPDLVGKPCSLTHLTFMSSLL